jgi:hypothetical protein
VDSSIIKIRNDTFFKIVYDQQVHQRQIWDSKTFGQYFDQISLNGVLTNLAVCKERKCLAILDKRGGGNLRAHLKELHRIDLSNTAMALDDFKRSLVKFVVSTNQPMRIVDECTFQDLLLSYEKLTFIILSYYFLS